MRPDYADLSLLIEERAQPDRAPQMPLLGLVAGFVLALTLWSGIAWLILAVLR
jgi:hypothetical protein